MDKIKTIKVRKIPLSDARKEDLRNHPLYRKAREYAEHLLHSPKAVTQTPSGEDYSLLSKEGGNDV